MKLNLHELPELPAESHSFFLLPEREARLGDSVVRYREAGHGKPILLLHGLRTRSYTFRSLLGPLSAKHRVVLPELVCPDGHNPLAGPDYRPEGMAQLIPRLNRALDLVSPVVVAHAESGLAALHLALTHPENLCALVTLGMAVEVPALLRLKGWLLSKDGFAERWAQKGCAKPQQAALEMLDYADPTVVSRQEIRQLSQLWSTRPGARAISRILVQTLSSAFYQPTLDRLEEHLAAGKSFPVPLKLVYGDSDRRAPVQQGERLNRQIPGSELLVAEQSSGAAQVEKPGWTARVILSAAGS